MTTGRFLGFDNWIEPYARCWPRAPALSTEHYWCYQCAHKAFKELYGDLSKYKEANALYDFIKAPPGDFSGGVFRVPFIKGKP